MSEEKLLILELHSKSRCYSLVDIRKFLTGSDGEDLHLFAAFISLSLSHKSTILLPFFSLNAGRRFLVMRQCSTIISNGGWRVFDTTDVIRSGQ
jgi:hypothetical protein